MVADVLNDSVKCKKIEKKRLSNSKCYKYY